jgi:hypothetical protein
MTPIYRAIAGFVPVRMPRFHAPCGSVPTVHRLVLLRAVGRDPTRGVVVDAVPHLVGDHVDRSDPLVGGVVPDLDLGTVVERVQIGEADPDRPGAAGAVHRVAPSHWLSIRASVCAPNSASTQPVSRTVALPLPHASSGPLKIVLLAASWPLRLAMPGSRIRNVPPDCDVLSETGLGPFPVPALALRSL